jgi:uncharacterized protein YndB with AHSA1/START domain
MPALHDTFTLRRSFPQSRERLFAALADPMLKQRWYADATMQPQRSEMDFRVGGVERQRYVLNEDSPFPGVVLENEGRFEDIVKGERVVVSTSMNFGGRRISTSLLTFELHDEDEGCGLRFTHQAVFYDGADGPEMRRGGWETMLDALARSLAS